MDQQSRVQHGWILQLPVFLRALRNPGFHTQVGTLHRILVLLLVYLAGFTAHAATPTEPVFGPKIYGAHLVPVTVTDNVTIPVGVAAPFKLVIENGGPTFPILTRVGTATVAVNGVQILGPVDFNVVTPLLERAINLNSGNNTLAVTVWGVPTKYFRLRILGTPTQAIPTSLTPNPLVLTAGTTANITATLSPPPGSAGSVAVSSANAGVASTPASVGFNAGQTSVTIPVAGVAQGNTTVSVSLNGSSVSATVNVGAAPPTVTSLTPATLTVAQGASSTLTVTLSSAPIAATTVNLASSAVSIASVRASVSVAAGALTAAIPVTAIAPGTAMITASLNGSSQSAAITVTPPPPTVASLTPATLNIAQGASGAFTVTLTSPPSTATTVTLSSDAASIATVPTSVTVAPGNLTAVVPVTGTAAGTAQITASLNGTSQSATVTVTPTIIISGQTPKDVILPGGSKPEIGAAYSVSTGAIDTAQVTLSLNGASVRAQSLITPTGALYLPPQGLANGTYTVVVSVRDLAGNVATDTWSFTVRDPAPNFYDEAPRDVAIVDTQPNIRVLLSGFNIDPASIRLSLDGADVTAQANVANGVISFTPSLPLAPGLHTVSANATDGNGVAGSKTWSFTVQTIPAPAVMTDGERTPNTFVPTLTLPE